MEEALKELAWEPGVRCHHENDITELLPEVGKVISEQRPIPTGQ